MRNENAYYCCVAQLSATLPLPLPHLPALYLAGDSHSLSPSWREVSLANPNPDPNPNPNPNPDPNPNPHP